MRTVSRGALYEAALSDTDDGELAALLSRGLGARSTIVHWMQDRPEMLSSSYFPSEIIAGFQEFAHLDPWTKAAMGMMDSGKAVRLSRFVPQRSYLESAFFHEFVRPVGDDTAHAMGVVFKTAKGLGAVALHRGLGQPDFDEEQEAHLQALAADLGRVLALKGRLAVAERRSLRLGENLDALACAVMHVNKDGALLFANAAAEAVLRRNDGLSVRGGRLQADEPRARARLEAVLRRASDLACGDTLIVPRSGGREAYPITAAPLTRDARAPAVLLLLTDPDFAPAPRREQLQTFYGLTSAEAEVCQALVEGLSIAEIADRRRVTVSTARTLLKYAMAKVGAARQGELIAKLARLSHLRPSGENAERQPVDLPDRAKFTVDG